MTFRLGINRNIINCYFSLFHHFIQPNVPLGKNFLASLRLTNVFSARLVSVVALGLESGVWVLPGNLFSASMTATGLALPKL
jgi:hypothetical protein